jgi:hypothetical protein
MLTIVHLMILHFKQSLKSANFLNKNMIGNRIDAELQKRPSFYSWAS